MVKTGCKQGTTTVKEEDHHQQEENYKILSSLISEDTFVPEFMARYRKLILDVAGKTFGAGFDEDDVLEEAALTWIEWYTYRSKVKSQKEASSFVWFLKKRFTKNRAKGLDSCIKACSFSPRHNSGDMLSGTMTHEDYALEFANTDDFSPGAEQHLGAEETLFYAKDMSLDNEIFPPDEDSFSKDDLERERQAGQKYVVCFDSFADRHILSMDILEIIKCLAGKPSDCDERQYRALRKKIRSKNSISKKIITALTQCTRKANLFLYRAVCLNGTRNCVYLIAQNKSEAQKYLKPYGALLDLKVINLPAI